MDSDFEFALKLQSQFLSEDEEKSSVVKKVDSENSLVDPSWEITDPNPDIYLLFQLFNQRFFWNSLGSVEVKWSSRMTSCAGICTYKGLRGCTVSLSLPLLKLRPRKDLVETLLHEMIHAFLFVTHNNKDRDGHGLEFHKHMYRINNEAGTKISVYHSFHDEVRHYKTHVWRCDGPCRSRPPYFGVVRRAMNRAPGPSDFWYEQHRLTCGGTFIKTSEPESFRAKKKKTCDVQDTKQKNSGKLGNITNYYLKDSGQKLGDFQSPLNKLSTPDLKQSPINNQSLIQHYFGGTKSNISNVPNIVGKVKSGSNVGGFGPTVSSGGTIVKHSGSMNNVHGFTNLSKPGTSRDSSYPSSGGRGGGTKMSNRGGTLLEKPKVGYKSMDNVSPKPSSSSGQSVQPFSGRGFTLSSGPSDRSKSRLLNLIPTSKPKKPELESENAEATLGNPGKGLIRCPVCNMSVDSSNINEHLDECICLEKVMSATETIVIEDSDDESEEQNGAASLVKCPNCDYKGLESTINTHLDKCLSVDFDCFQCDYTL